MCSKKRDMRIRISILSIFSKKIVLYIFVIDQYFLFPFFQIQLQFNINKLQACEFRHDPAH